MVKFVELNLYISTTKVRIFLFGTDNFILELQYTYISTYVVTIILDTLPTSQVMGAEHKTS